MWNPLPCLDQSGVFPSQRTTQHLLLAVHTDTARDASRSQRPEKGDADEQRPETGKVTPEKNRTGHTMNTLRKTCQGKHDMKILFRRSCLCPVTQHQSGPFPSSVRWFQEICVKKTIGKKPKSRRQVCFVLDCNTTPVERCVLLCVESPHCESKLF